MNDRHGSYNKNIDFEVLVPHVQSLPAYKGYKNLLNPLPLPRSSFDQNIRIRALEAKVDALMKKVAGLEVDNNDMAAMIATITSPPEDETYPSPFDPPPSPIQNERLSIKLPARKIISPPGQVDHPNKPSTSILGPKDTATLDGSESTSPFHHATGAAVPVFTFNTPPRPVRGPMRLSFEAALAGQSQPLITSPSTSNVSGRLPTLKYLNTTAIPDLLSSSDSRSPLRRISDYIASTVLPEFLGSSPVRSRHSNSMVGPQSISDEDFAALMDETEDAINNLAHHHLGWTTGDRDDEIEGGTIGNTSATEEPMDETATEDETAAAVQLTSTSTVDFTTADINITAEVNPLEVKNTTTAVDTLEAAVETMAAMVDTTAAVDVTAAVDTTAAVVNTAAVVDTTAAAGDAATNETAVGTLASDTAVGTVASDTAVLMGTKSN